MVTAKKIKEIQELQKKGKARRETGLFVVEGERIVSELPEDRIEELYLSEEYVKAHPGKRAGEVLPDHVFAKLSDTKTPQGILAVMRKPVFVLEEALRTNGGLYLALEAVQDPGNLGTIFRTAEGAGVTAIFLIKGTADLYAPKTVRSTMGSIYRQPYFFVETVREAAELMKNRGIRLYAAALSGERRYDEADYRGSSAFLIGNEGNGLSETALSLADQRVRIPMKGALESLNASVAASLLMYEAARQRGFV